MMSFRSFLFLIVICVLNTSAIYTQIESITIAEPVEEKNTYDSLSNFLGDQIHQYIGQTLYVKGKSETNRRWGYKNFSRFLPKRGTHYLRYEILAGKYLFVEDAITTSDAFEETYLILVDKQTNDKFYYRYDSSFVFERSFPFIIVGYFEKLKETYVGQTFIFSDALFEESLNIETGEPLNIETGESWECLDLRIDDKDFELIFIVSNSSNIKTSIKVNSLIGKFPIGEAYSTAENEKYIEKFGQYDWITILKGKIRVGFTEEMVLMSWGEPDSKNQASYGDQWVYGTQYVYFENGILTAFN